MLFSYVAAAGVVIVAVFVVVVVVCVLLDEHFSIIYISLYENCISANRLRREQVFTERNTVTEFKIKIKININRHIQVYSFKV